LDRLDMTSGWTGVDIHESQEGNNDDPIVIQNCTIRAKGVAVSIDGADRGNFDRPQPVRHVIVRNNRLIGCDEALTLRGEVHHVHVVGNCLMDSRNAAISLGDLLPGAADVLVANNTMLRNGAAVTVWDDHSKGMAFKKCKNIWIQNNL